MARGGGLFTISTSIFVQPEFLALGDRERWMVFYLYGGRHKSLIGACFLPDEWISPEFDLPVRTVTQSIARLTEAGFVRRFSDGKHLMLPRFYECNTIRNEGILRGALAQLRELPPDPVLAPVVEWLELFVERWPECLSEFAIVRQPIDRMMAEQCGDNQPTIARLSPNKPQSLSPFPVPFPRHTQRGFDEEGATAVAEVAGGDGDEDEKVRLLRRRLATKSA